MAEGRRLADNGVIENPDTAMRWVGQRLGGDVFPLTSSNGLAGQLLRDPFRVVFALALAALFGAIGECEPVGVHVISKREG